MHFGVVVEARDEGGNARIGLDFRRVKVEFLAPDQLSFLAEVDDFLEEALEDPDPEPLPDAGQARVIWKVLVQGVAEVPAMRQVETCGCDELALGADPLEEHD